MEEIVIKYKSETLQVDEMTEREKAIYDVAYNRGYRACEEVKDRKPILVALLFGIIITLYQILF